MKFLSHFSTNENVQAYAKLEGPNFKEFVLKPIVFIGRDPEENGEQVQSISISGSSRISRKHAKIFWDYSEACWKIQNLSKNKIVVNQIILSNTSNPLILRGLEPIKIDFLLFYFFPGQSYVPPNNS